MNEAERYLRAATRGLWGRQRREVRAELRGHIAVRMQELRLSGLSEAEAERQTLRELGAPAEVRTGMLGVHTLPVLGQSGLAAMLAATLLIGTLPHGQAQVSGIFDAAGQGVAAAYLDFAQLQAEVEKVGGKLSGTPEEAALSLPGVRGATLPSPGWPWAALRQQDRTYVSAPSLLYALLASGADVQLRGWTNPVLRVGKTALQIRTTDWRVSNNLYSTTLWSHPQLTRQIPGDILEPNGDALQVTLKGNFQAGQVYALVTPIFRSWWRDAGPKGQPGQRGNMNLAINTSVAAKGQVTFRIYTQAEHFKLMPSVDAMHRDLAPHLKSGALSSWSARMPAPSVVLALSGYFGPDAYTVVSPQGLQQH